jgi:hypothetical protein
LRVEACKAGGPLGLAWQILMPFGVFAGDWRGLYMRVGA